jgi:hypothetical protein
MFRPNLKGIGLQNALWQATGISSVGLQVCQQVIIGAAITVPPVIDSARQFPFLATSMELNQARMIWPAMVGISSS